ncbi:MAG: SDR family oxidoreductase [Gammaproteobacteria bacterium]
MPAITLVTGATGTVGREVVRGLLAQGVSVRAGARTGRQLVHLGPIDCCVLDLDRPQTAARALEGVQRVFFLSPLNEQMVDVGCQFVEQATAAGVEHIVRLSALGAGSCPATQLALVHRAVEEAIETSGLHYTFLRPNAFMQNYVNAFGGSIRSKGLFEMPQGRGAVSLVDVRDIAAVAVVALMDLCHRGRSYELTGPEPLSNDDVAEILSEVTHRPIRYVDISERQARDALLGQGMPVWLVEVLLELYAISRAGMAASISSAVQELLGRPPIHFRQFAADYAEQFR